MNMRRNNRRPPPPRIRTTTPEPPEIIEEPFQKLRTPLIHTPANCQKLKELRTVSGTAEPGVPLTVVIDGNEERVVTADESSRWYLCGVELSPGYHTISVDYQSHPSISRSKVWVYIDMKNTN